ncbi:unnamed protein product [Cylicocyclus nassatus]|uniref:SCP domain-containing protein n=1 Tax=Cylicocyclus nassatus TaxID=53992 RepID=A0AA36GZF2_CYLNA|nr:unnamed protein product [Cylicocyclus nassatus]
MDVVADCSNVYFDDIPKDKRAHGKAEIYYWGQGGGYYKLAEIMHDYLKTIENEKLTDVSDNWIKYSGEDNNNMEKYANLVRASTTEIGCALAICEEVWVNAYCVTNQPPLADGDWISGPGEYNKR